MIENSFLSKGLALFIFIGLILFVIYSPFVDRIFMDRCCDFQKSEIDGELEYVTFGKSGNVFTIKGQEKKYYFLNKERFNEPNVIFGNIAQEGQKVIKKKYSDTLVLYTIEKEYSFEIINCCDSLDSLDSLDSSGNR